MIIGWILYFVAIGSLFFVGVAGLYSIPSSEFNALKDLYLATDGIYWKWKTPYTSYGYPWNFDNPTQNPCNISHIWQGIICSSSCETQPCSVMSLSLSATHLNGKFMIRIVIHYFLESF